MKQLLFVIIISTFFSTNIIAQLDLTGLENFSVRLIFDGDLDKEGYDSETIKTDTELQLRLAGINVIDHEQYISDKLNKTAIMQIYVHAFIDEIGYIYHIRLSIIELVTVPRLNRDDYLAMTWVETELATVPSGYKGWQFIRESAKDLVNKFLNDYLKDNPKN